MTYILASLALLGTSIGGGYALDRIYSKPVDMPASSGPEKKTLDADKPRINLRRLATAEPQPAQKIDDALKARAPSFPPDVLARLNLTKRELNQQRRSSFNELCKLKENGRICGQLVPDKTNVLVIGDSFGYDALWALSTGYPDLNIIANISDGCPLLFDLEGATFSNKDCETQVPESFADIETILPNIDAVLISIKVTQDRTNGLKSTVDWLKERDANIIMLGVNPWMGGEGLPQRILDRGQLDGLDEALSGYFITREYPQDDELENYVQACGGRYIRKLDFFCPDRSKCKVMTTSGWPILQDRTHLTSSASQAFGAYLAKNYPDLFSSVSDANDE